MELLHVQPEGRLWSSGSPHRLAQPPPALLCKQSRPGLCEWPIRVRPLIDFSAGLCLTAAPSLSLIAFQETPKVYPPVMAEKRKPIRVLSLFDGIATGERAGGGPPPHRAAHPPKPGRRFQLLCSPQGCWC